MKKTFLATPLLWSRFAALRGCGALRRVVALPAGVVACVTLGCVLALVTTAVAKTESNAPAAAGRVETATDSEMLAVPDAAAADNSAHTVSGTPAGEAESDSGLILTDRIEIAADVAAPEASPLAAAPAVTLSDLTANVYVVPIEGEINRTQLFILRRALKEALRNDVDTVVLDMDTPGGALNVTLEMMEALQRFPGKTITYVNAEAVSAGSFISMATDEIWFAPGGIMGAAEAVSGGGQDIAEGMQRKIRSYLHAKVRSLDSESRYRADVQRAMMDPTFVFEVDGVVLSKDGELLSLTATEAAKTYGEPPESLLSSGTVASVNELLDGALGAGNYTIRHYELTWSESFAKWFQALSPLLLGVGIMLLFIEFKTPGFGVLGGIGVGLLLLVFASNYFAGLAGYEVLLIFLLGVCLLAVEVLVLPGTLVAGGIGVLLILGSLLWAMADVWPKGAEDFTFSADLFARPLLNLGIGLVIAVIGAIVIAKLLPRTRVGRSLILSTSVGGVDPLIAGGGHRSVQFGTAEGRPESQTAATPAASAAMFSTATHPSAAVFPDTDASANADGLPAVGRRGTAVTPLRPGGQVEIDGRRYEARLLLGQIDKGEIIEVIGYRDFALLVRRS